MLKYALIGSLMLSLALTSAVWFQSSRADSLQIELQQANDKLVVRDAIIRQRNAADAIHKARIEELERESEELRVEIDTLNDMEGRDAPLSDLLRATGTAADRLLHK